MSTIPFRQHKRTRWEVAWEDWSSGQLHFPGYHYLGPGTSDMSREPINVIDAAAREHDLAYKQWKDYFVWNQADEDFIQIVRDNYHVDPAAAKIVLGIFEWKRDHAPHAAGVQPGHKRRRIEAESKLEELSDEEFIEQAGAELEQPDQQLEPDIANDQADLPKMPYRHKHHKKRSRHHGKVRSHLRSSKSRRLHHSKHSTFGKKLAAVLNPETKYVENHLNVFTTIAADQQRSLWFTPHMVTTTARTVTAGRNPWTKAMVAYIGNLVLGNNIATEGLEFWALKTLVKIKFQNSSNSPMHLTIFWLKCKNETDNDALTEMNTDSFPNTMFTGQSGTSIFNPRETGFVYDSDKKFILKDAMFFKTNWALAHKKAITLGPGEFKTFYQKSGAYLATLEKFDKKNNRKGGLDMIVRMDGDISATDDVVVNDFGKAGYPIQKCVTDVEIVMHLAKKVTSQKQIYLNNPAGIGCDDNLGTAVLEWSSANAAGVAMNN